MTARDFLDDAQQKAVGQAVAEAEKRTCAEIVCAVATESGRYDRAESVVGLAMALLLLSVVQGLFGSGPESWERTGAPVLYEGASVVLGFLLGNVVATLLPWLRTPFVPRAEMEEETGRAASHVFTVKRLGSTRSRGGVLIYLSLFERRVVVLADHGGLQAVGQEGLNELRDLATARLREGKRLEALTDTIARTADLLAPTLPWQEGDTNELPDELLLIHPRP